MPNGTTPKSRDYIPNESSSNLASEIEEPIVSDSDLGIASRPRVRKNPASKKSRKRRVADSAYSGDEFRRRPSERPEFAPGSESFHRRSRARVGWRVLGKWAREYRRLTGKEDQTLFVASGKDLFPKAKNISDYVARWLDGDSDKALAAVDRILVEAESLGYPVSIMYYFSPSREGALPRLLEGKPHGSKSKRGAAVDVRCQPVKRSPEETARLMAAKEKKQAELAAKREEERKAREAEDERKRQNAARRKEKDRQWYIDRGKEIPFDLR